MNTYNSSIEVKNAVITFRKEKIVQIHYKSHLFSLNDNLEIFRIIREHSPWRSAPIFVSGDDFYNHDAESKTFFAGPEIGEHFSAVGFLANNLAQKMVIRFFILMYKPKAEVRFFFSEEEAIDWLTAFVE